jgi:hypothetical protein
LRITWLIRTATAIAANDPSASQSLYPYPEWVRVGHIGILLLAGRNRLAEARRVTYYLGKLTPRYVVTWSEGVIGIAGDHAPAYQASNVKVKWIGGWHIAELEYA